MGIGFILISIGIGTFIDTGLFMRETTRWLVSYNPSVINAYMIQNAIEGGCTIAGLLWGYILYRPEIHEHYKKVKKHE
jgi:hypothetical protein